MADDTPRMWIDDEPKYDPETGEIIEETSEQTDLAIMEEIPLPTIEEQNDIIKQSSLSEEGKSLLGSLVEMNNIANTLTLLRNSETAEIRKTVLNAMCEGFVHARMQNNISAEALKRKLLDRLLEHVEDLDLQTVAQIYNDLNETSAVDSQQAMTTLNGGTSTLPGSGGTTVNLNLATGEGANMNVNTLNAQPQQVQQLKEVASLNTSLRAWQNIPGKKQPIQAQIVDGTKK